MVRSTTFGLMPNTPSVGSASTGRIRSSAATVPARRGWTAGLAARLAHADHQPPGPVSPDMDIRHWSAAGLAAPEQGVAHHRDERDLRVPTAARLLLRLHAPAPWAGEVRRLAHQIEPPRGERPRLPRGDRAPFAEPGHRPPHEHVAGRRWLEHLPVVVPDRLEVLLQRSGTDPATRAVPAPVLEAVGEVGGDGPRVGGKGVVAPLAATTRANLRHPRPYAFRVLGRFWVLMASSIAAMSSKSICVGAPWRGFWGHTVTVAIRFVARQVIDRRSSDSL